MADTSTKNEEKSEETEAPNKEKEEKQEVQAQNLSEKDEEATKMKESTETKKQEVETKKQEVETKKEKGGGSSYSTDEELDMLIDRLRKSIDLPGYNDGKFTREHQTLIREFFSHPTERV